VADEKKTQLGQTPGRTHRPTGGQQPVAGTDATAPPHAKTSYLPPSEDKLLGTTLADRYLIQKKLGEGGMGAVYLATHKILEKQVALKILHGEFSRKPDLVDRFIQEAKAASRIRHENVIDISDFGTTGEYVFFAMELLTGHDLHDEITRARVTGHLLPWSRTKKIFLQICAALSAAHAKGIVHRDLKPENVYLVDFLGDPDFVKLLDFGIAKLTEGAEEGGRKLTKTGMLFGTPEYMSPEQARGEQVDHRVDIYAMGCILFQLVTNRVPFEADNFMGVLSMHLTEPPPSIAPEVFDQIGAPRELAAVIDRALLKDRNARFQSIDELANAVRQVCGDAMPSGTTTRAASVPSPSTTTTRRAATPTNVGPEQTGRIKTQWTGNISVPETLVGDDAKPKSKAPLIIGAVVAVSAIAAVAGIIATRGGSSNGAGSAAQVATGSGSAMVTPPPQPPPPPPPEPKLPDMVKITLDTTPHGATVTDMSTGKPLPGKTPMTVSVPGAKATRQYAFHLHGYGDSIVELPLAHDVNWVETLAKGASAGTPAIHKVTDATLPNVGSNATKPDTGSATTKPDTGPVTHPDTGSAATKPDTGSATTKPPCDDSDPLTPCLKGFGSASK
jgi:serine/threonine-protein kinase